jgi:hypothetical protein
MLRSSQEDTTMLLKKQGEGDEVLKEIKTNRMGNLEISLFWEEKALIIIRFIQFYGYLLMVFYE